MGPVLLGIALFAAIAAFSTATLLVKGTDALLLEYEVSTPAGLPTAGRAGINYIDATIINLSRDKSVKRLRVSFSAQGKGTLLASASTMAANTRRLQPEAPAENTVRYVLEDMQPGEQYAARVVFVGNHAPALTFVSDAPLRVMRPSWETWFAKHERWLAIGIAVWALALALLYAMRRSGRQLGWPATRAAPTWDTVLLDEHVELPASPTEKDKRR